MTDAEYAQWYAEHKHVYYGHGATRGDDGQLQAKKRYYQRHRERLLRAQRQRRAQTEPHPEAHEGH